MDRQDKKSSKALYNPPLLGMISIVSVIYLLYYLWWRATATLNPGAPLFSWILLTAEAFGVFSYILFSWMTLDISPSRAFKPPVQGLKVDVFVPTYNEDLSILEATLVGCRSIKYPHKTHLLDDGNRPEVRELAGRLGANYIARGTHEHAKAGNINHALALTDGEFIVILDADMVPQPDYLERTLGYFDDEKLALVQLPQEFYNHDSIQHAPDSPSWHEQALFFRVIQPGKNYSNSAFWCGSPSLVRRTALLEVGGVATETITEDIHTTVRLHSRGWRTLFVNEPLAFGIAPQTIRAFLLQRLRWAQGTMQLYRGKESPLWIPGLTFSQRISYLASFLAYFESFQKMVLLLTPVAILTFGIFPMQVSVGSFLLRWAPYFLLNILANQVGGRGIFQYFRTEKFNILKMIVFIQSTLTLVHKKPLTFKVTPKSVDATVYARERQALRWYMVIAGVLTGSMLYGLLEIFSPRAWLLTMDVFFIAFFWAAYNQIVILLAISEVFQKQHERSAYRFPVDLKANLSSAESRHFETRARVLDLSVSGAGLVVDNDFPREMKDLSITFRIPNSSVIKLPVEKIQYQKAAGTGHLSAGISFSPDLGVQRELLFEYLFVTLPAAKAQTFYRVNRWNTPHQLQRLIHNVLSEFGTAQES
jgi:cellulose synthase (UDP-forming)